MGRRLPNMPTLRAAWWTLRSLRRVRAQLASAGLDGVRISPPPVLPADAERGVLGTLRRTRATCLQAALIRQAWHTAHGRRAGVVIGVAGSGDEFRAHAWLEGDPAASSDGFAELHRRAARS